MWTEVNSRPQGPSGPAQAPVRASPCAICATREQCLIGGLPRAAAELGPQVREGSFRQGDTLLQESDRTAHLRLLKVGTVFVCRTRRDGTVQPLGIAARGMVFGLCGYAGQPNQISAVASTSGRYCEIPLELVESLAQHDPVFRERVGKGFTDNVGFMARWAQLRGHRGVVAQVAGSLSLIMDEQRTEAIDVPSHTAVARMLGTTRESVARAIALLEAGGCLVRTGPRRCEIRASRLREWLAQNG